MFSISLQTEICARVNLDYHVRIIWVWLLGRRVWQHRTKAAAMKVWVLITLTALVLRVSARPNGAPVEACSSLIPQHFPNVPQDRASPIALDVSSIPVVGYDPESSYRRKC